MDQNTPREDAPTKPLKPARVALNVLALCFALSVLGRGLGESFTVFLKPISEDFGWDRAQVVSVYSLTWLAGGLTAPLVGRLFDRSGPRMVYSLGLFLLGGAFLIAAHAQQLWQFQLSVGLCVGLGIALIGNVPNSILLGRWFGPRLPTAMAILYSATGAGILVLLPASQLLIDRIGWRDAYQLFGIVALCLLLPLLVLPWRLFATGSPHIARKADADFVDNGWTLGSAMRHHAFWALFSTFFFTAVGDVRDHGADRRLSDRRRISAAAGGDRLGLFRHRDCCSACSASPRSTASSAAGRRCCSATASRSSASSCSGCCNIIRTTGC